VRGINTIVHVHYGPYIFDIVHALEQGLSHIREPSFHSTFFIL